MTACSVRVVCGVELLKMPLSCKALVTYGFTVSSVLNASRACMYSTMCHVIWVQSTNITWRPLYTLSSVRFLKALVMCVPCVEAQNTTTFLKYRN